MHVASHSSTPFASRVADDVDGFYGRLRQTLGAHDRPHQENVKENEQPAAARFVLDGPITPTTPHATTPRRRHSA